MDTNIDTPSEKGFCPDPGCGPLSKACSGMTVFAPPSYGKYSGARRRVWRCAPSLSEPYSPSSLGKPVEPDLGVSARLPLLWGVRNQVPFLSEGKPLLYPHSRLKEKQSCESAERAASWAGGSCPEPGFLFSRRKAAPVLFSTFSISSGKCWRGAV